MKYIVTIDGKNYEVEVEKGEASIIRTTESANPVVQHPESAVTAQSTSVPAPASELQKSQVQLGDGEALKSPMPGVVLDIKVSTGTAVKRGDVLFILEAMKMENEITAPKDGVVAQILVVKGASVSTGDVLAVIQ